MKPYEWLSLLVSLVGIGLVVWSIRYAAKQTQAGVLSDFSARYAKIDEDFPSVWKYHRKAEITKDQKDEYFKYLERYFQIFHQEHELRRMRTMDSRIWNITVKHAERHARGHHFQEFWESENGRAAFEPNRTFVEFVDKLAL